MEIIIVILIVIAMAWDFLGILYAQGRGGRMKWH